MNTKPLFAWLGLPPGPWPPDDRTLLGLPPGPVDPLVAELRAMERMDRLRPHQLVQPDLVTEGMNRLAQALVALSAAGPPSAAPAPLPPAPRRKPAAPVRVERSPAPRAEPPAFEAVDFALPGPAVPPAAEAVAVPEVVEAEVVEAEVVPLAPAPPPPPRPRRTPRVQPPPEPEPTLAPPAPDGLVVPARGRRQAYRELAGLRALRRAWRRLRASVADPSEPLAGPTEVCGFLEAVSDVRAALRRSGMDELTREAAGGLVRSVAGNAFALSVLRSLVPSQRQALARDWAMGLAAIETRYGAVRAFQLNTVRGIQPARRRVRSVARGVGRNPEWLLGGLTAVAAVTLAVRLAGR